MLARFARCGPTPARLPPRAPGPVGQRGAFGAGLRRFWGAGASRGEAALWPALALVPTSQAAGARILVVDDEEHVRVLLKDILESEGHCVSLACGGREALELLGASAFDAIFTDLGKG